MPPLNKLKEFLDNKQVSYEVLTHPVTVTASIWRPLSTSAVRSSPKLWCYAEGPNS